MRRRRRRKKKKKWMTSVQIQQNYTTPLLAYKISSIHKLLAYPPSDRERIKKDKLKRLIEKNNEDKLYFSLNLILIDKLYPLHLVLLFVYPQI